MGTTRLGIALLALSLVGVWDVSLGAQLDAHATIVPSAAAPARHGAFARARSVARLGPVSRAGNVTFPARLMVQARQQHAAMPIAMPAATTSLAGPWQPVGPLQVVSPYFGKVTGRVTSIAIDRSDSTGNTVYVGTTGGGVWKSQNAAASASQVKFLPLTDTLPAFSSGKNASLSIGALSIQPGGTGVVLAGTGDPNDAMDSYYGSGLLRSTDKGVSWSLIEDTRDINRHYSFIGEGFAGFAWSTVSPNLVVAAVSEAAEGTIVNGTMIGTSQRGLYYSADAGATWFLATITDGDNKLIQAPNLLGWMGAAATSVVWNPIRKRFYAAVRYHGYYDSPDGITWTRLDNQPGAQLAAIHCPITPGSPGSLSCHIFRGSLAVQPVTGDLFAFTVDRDNTDIGLWQDACNLQSGGCAAPVSFQKQLSTAALDVPDGSQTILQGTYNQWLAAVPSQADTLLYLGTVDVSHCSLLNNCVWRNTTHSTSCGAAKVSPSQHAVDFLAGAANQPFPGLMFFGNDGGLWRTTNGINQTSPVCSADDAAAFDNLNGSIGSLAEIGGLAQHPTDASVFLAGLGANGTAAPALPGDVAWPQVVDGEGATTAIDPINPQNWYTTSGPGVAIEHCTVGTACNPSTFGQPAIGNTQTANDGQTMQVPAVFALDATDPSQMLVGTCRVWRGPANGVGWSAANAISSMLDGAQEPACNGNSLIRSLASSASPTGEWLYAGMAGRLEGQGITPGHIFRAQWSGGVTSAWTDISVSPVTNSSQRFNPGAFAVSSIVPDPHDLTGQTVYVTIEGFSGNTISVALLYRTTDAGAHWTDLTSNLPSAPANSVAVDPQDANTIYVALDTGVYVTRQLYGCNDPLINCWSVYGTSLPNAPVTQLLAYAGSPAAGSTAMLRAGTYGRGIWQIGMASAQSTQTTATLLPGSFTFGDTPLQTTAAWQTFTVTNTGTQPLQVTQVTASGDFARQYSCAAPIPAQGTCSVQVSFTPTQQGVRTGTLNVFGNLPSGQLAATLNGNGIKGAGIVLLPTSMDFGTIATGATSATQFLTISNVAGATMALGATTVTGPYTLTANTCGAALAPAHGCTVGIAFSPVASGTATGSFTVSDDAGTQTAPLIGRGALAATDTLGPLTLTFPAQIVATNSAAQLVTLTNDGDSALMLIRAVATGDFSVTNNCGASLAGHSSCAFSVAFHPSRIGQQTGTLTVTDLVATHTVALSGIGLAPAGISLTPASVDFGGVGIGGSSAQTVTLTNNGGVSLDGIVLAVAGDFAITTNGCGLSLAAGTSCTFQAVFSPTQTGERSGNLIVTSSSVSTFNVPLNGSGEDFQLVVVGPASASVVTGQNASFALRLVPVVGSIGTVTFSCAGAPKNATCTVSPTSAQIAGGNTVSVGVTVATGLATTAGPVSSSGRKGLGGGAGAALLTLALLFPAGWRLRRSRALWMLVLLVCVVFAPLGCGVAVSGGKQSAPSNPAPPNATPVGTYTLTITAASTGIQRTATVNLMVQ